MSKKVLIELDEKYADVISFTVIGMCEAKNVWGCELSVTSRCCDLREGNHITVNSEGLFNQDNIEGL